MTRRLSSFVLIAFTLLLSAAPAQAQLWDKVKDAAKRGAERAVERETSRRADRAVTEAFGLAEDAVVCAVTDETCIEEAQADGQDVVVVDEEGDPLPASQQPSVQANEAAATSPAAASAAPMAPGEGVWTNYDFVPGNRVLYVNDYERDNVGDFPRRYEFVRGNWEVAEWQGRRLLRHTGPRHAAYKVVLPEALPERFTVEFDVYFPHGNQQLVMATSEPESANLHAGYDHNFVIIDGRGSGIEHRETAGVKSTNSVRTINQELTPIRVMADGSYVKVYLGEQRVANIPNADFPRTNVLWFQDTNFADQENPMYIGPLRVAAGGRDLYDRLEADGRVATQGILFDTGSATIQPESTPTLKEIARTLQQHGDLRLRIEGHTDNVGSADANLQLSERRAAAVRDYLVQREGIDAGRLESAGLGQTAPAADNATPEGRQTNRRVELVVL